MPEQYPKTLPPKDPNFRPVLYPAVTESCAQVDCQMPGGRGTLDLVTRRFQHLRDKIAVAAGWLESGNHLEAWAEIEWSSIVSAVREMDGRVRELRDCMKEHDAAREKDNA